MTAVGTKQTNSKLKPLSALILSPDVVLSFQAVAEVKKQPMTSVVTNAAVAATKAPNS